MKQKRVAIIALTLAIIAIISGCGSDKQSGLNFTLWKNGDALRTIMAGVKSEKTDFSLDDVTLDFYYGSTKELPNYTEKHDLQAVGMGVYLGNSIDCKPVYYAHDFQTEDYLAINGLHFVRFIEMEEYDSDEFDVRTFWLKNPTFNHNETLTVPSSIFKPNDIDNRKTYFCIVLLRIVYIKSKGMYSYDLSCFLSVAYEILDDGKVRLSEGGNAIF